MPLPSLECLNPLQYSCLNIETSKKGQQNQSNGQVSGKIGSSDGA